MAFQFHPEVMVDSLPLLVGIQGLTLKISAAGLVLGLLAGILTAGRMVRQAGANRPECLDRILLFAVTGLAAGMGLGIAASQISGDGQALSGLELTLFITVCGLILGLILGSAAGLINTGHNRFLRALAVTYIEIIRGTPLIVQVMFLYFGLPLVMGIRIPPLTAGIVAIGVNAGAYIAEIVRGAIVSIDAGQGEAARSTGLTGFQAMRYVIWPQAFRRMIPPLGNQFIISLKDTSLLVVIGVAELTRQGQEIISINFRAFEIWLTVAIIYLCVTLTLSWILRRAERRLLSRVVRRTQMGAKRAAGSV